MAKGTESYESLAVPLQPAGGFEIVQQKASSATDIVTITAASSGTGNFIVAQNSAAVARFTVGADGNIVIASPTAATVALQISPLTNTPTGNLIQAYNTAGSKVFTVLPAGGIRTMVAFSTIAVASIASNASQSYTVTGATTDDAVLVLPLKTLTTNNGGITAFVGTADRIDIFTTGLSSSFAANTIAVWLFRTVANSATNT